VLEGKAEESRDDKIDQVLSKLTALELDMRSLVEKLSTQAATVARVEARVEGISSNHGSRLGTMEQTAVELRTRITQLETAGNKRRR
jgi:F0F1-type ATP synthase gamma subunit